MQDGFRDLLDAPQSNAIALLDGQWMVRIGDGELRPPSDCLRLYTYFKINSVTKEKELRVEPAGKWRFVLAPGHIPEIICPDKVFWADLGPYTPDEWLIQTDDGHENSSAQVKIPAVNHALVGSDDHALIQLVQRNRGHGLRSLHAVAQGQYLVPCPTDAARKSVF